MGDQRFGGYGIEGGGKVVLVVFPPPFGRHIIASSIPG